MMYDIFKVDSTPTPRVWPPSEQKFMETHHVLFWDDPFDTQLPLEALVIQD